MILDLACGPGIQASFLYRELPSIRYKGYDLAENMIKLARIRMPELDFGVADARKLNFSEMYDGILFSFLFPYLSRDETWALLSGCVPALHKKGVLYFSFISSGAYQIIDSSPSDDPDSHIKMYYYDPAEIQDKCESLGLEVIYREELQNPNGDKEAILVLRKE